MSGSALEIALGRDRVVAMTALAVLVALSWAYLLWIADMGGMDMPDMRMLRAGTKILMMPAEAPWSGLEFIVVFVMWSVMMIGMMLPSAAPMLLIYARVGRQALEQQASFAATGWFALGYLLVWTGFALIATLAQWGLDRLALLTPQMQVAGVTIGGAVLIVAGLYQWTPLKDVCLAQCQSPLVFIQRHGGFRRDRLGALVMGLRHGAYCVGCCWALMALLFVAGVMNVLWIAAIAILVLAEKVLPVGRLLARVAGAGFIAAGLGLLLM